MPRDEPRAGGLIDKHFLFKLLIAFLIIILINFAGRYMGIKETQDFLNSNYHTVLVASDICFENNYTYFIDLKNKRAGCTPSVPFQNGTWYIRLKNE